MFQTCVGYVLQCINFAFSLLDRLFTVFDGVWGFIFAVFIISLTYKYILAPIIGHAGSDKAKKNNPNAKLENNTGE